MNKPNARHKLSLCVPALLACLWSVLVFGAAFNVAAIHYNPGLEKQAPMAQDKVQWLVHGVRVLDVKVSPEHEKKDNPKASVECLSSAILPQVQLNSGSLPGCYCAVIYPFYCPRAPPAFL